MHMNIQSVRRYSFFLIVSLCLVLGFVLSACGSATTTGSLPSTPTTSATATAACPSSETGSARPASTVVLTSANSNTTVNVKAGNTVEIDLANDHKWDNPTVNPSNLLTTQGTAGFTSSNNNSCVWRFTAASTGTVDLSFTGRPICKVNQMCPMYVMVVPFTINIQ